jgi:hypothetical protein
MAQVKHFTLIHVCVAVQKESLKLNPPSLKLSEFEVN